MRHYKRYKATGDPLKTSSGITHDKSIFCGVDGCDLAPRTRGYCSKHHSRMLKWGDPLYPVAEKGASNKGRSHCSRCGEELTARGQWRRCENCHLASRVRNEGLRRARRLSAVCNHGPGCVSMSFIVHVRAGSCAYCAAPAEHADHLEPLARGGLHCRDNIVPACQSCNTRKRDKDPLEWLSEIAS